MVRVTVLVLDSAVLPHPLTALQHCQAAGCTSTHAPLPVSRRRQIYEPNTLEITRGALAAVAVVAVEPECISAQLRSRSPSRSTYIEWVDGWLVGRVLLASAQIK